MLLTVNDNCKISIESTNFDIIPQPSSVKITKCLSEV